jgi:quercetin dioxygenase-like cupin family protein
MFFRHGPLALASKHPEFSATSQGAIAADPAAPHESITPPFAEAIVNVPGRTMSALVVDYPPGGKSTPHRHGQAYVLSGAIRSRIDDG